MYQYTLAVLSVVAVFILPANVLADRTIYKCKTHDGELHYQKSPCDEGLQAINSWTAPVETVRPKQSITLEQGLGGHYFLESEVNGRELTFVIDTGATMVSLPNSIARAAEIDCQTTLLMETANGVTKACTATIAELKLGPFLMKDVPAVIVPNLLQPLLGMNILQRFNIAQEQSRMRISER